MPERLWIYPDRESDDGWPDSGRLVEVRLSEDGERLEASREDDGFWWTEDEGDDGWGEASSLLDEEVEAWRELP